MTRRTTAATGRRRFASSNFRYFSNGNFMVIKITYEKKNYIKIIT